MSLYPKICAFVTELCCNWDLKDTLSALKALQMLVAIIEKVRSMKQPHPVPVTAESFITRKQIAKMLNLSVGSLYRIERRDSTFPKRVMVCGRPRWSRSDVQQWIQSKRAI